MRGSRNQGLKLCNSGASMVCSLVSHAAAIDMPWGRLAAISAL